VRVRTRSWKVGRKASAWEAQVRRPRQAAAARRRERTSRRERMVATTAGGSAASIAGGVGHGSIGSGGDMVVVVVVVDGIAGRQIAALVLVGRRCEVSWDGGREKDRWRFLRRRR